MYHTVVHNKQVSDTVVSILSSYGRYLYMLCSWIDLHDFLKIFTQDKWSPFHHSNQNLRIRIQSVTAASNCPTPSALRRFNEKVMYR
jgi:hypothetical protein